ncbi:transposase [Streptococcus pneumoniae]|nr:transposase [Streptococcus pneumoniae]
MHIHYNTNQTTLPLEISSFLPQDHLVFTIEKVVNTLEERHFYTSSIMPLVARLITLKCLYLLFYLPIHKGFSLVEKLKNGRVSDLRLFVY